MEYKRKTDRDPLLTSIERYNRSMERREQFNRHVKEPVGKVIQKPGKAVYKTITSESDEELSEVRKISDNMELAAIVGGNVTDRMRDSSVKDVTYRADRLVYTGNMYSDHSYSSQVADIFRVTPEGLTVIDREKVTRGDIAAFEYKYKHQDASMEKLSDIRNDVNEKHNGGTIDLKKLGRNNALRKKIDQMVDSSEVNMLEDFIQMVHQDNSMVFHGIPGMEKIISKEDSLLLAKNHSELRINETIIDRILYEETFTGVISKLDPDKKMNTKELSKLLKERVPGINLKNPEHDLARAALKSKQINRESMVQAKKHQGQRGTVKSFARRKITGSLQESEEFADFYSSYGTAKKSTSVTVRAGKKVVGVTAKAAEKGAEMAGKGAIHVLQATGNQNAAEMLGGFGKKYLTVKDKVKNFYPVRNTVNKTTSRVMRHVGNVSSEIGKKLATTRAGRFLQENRTARTVSKVVRTGTKTAGKIMRAPFKLAGLVIDFVKKYIIGGLFAFFGINLLVMLILIAFSSITSSVNSTTILIMDTDEHYQAFQTQYEQSQAAFQAQIDSIVNGIAKTLNKKGEEIRYGINVPADEERGIEAQYENGVTMNFDSSKSNNLEDILSVMTVIMEQDMEQNHEAALALIDALYQSSHTYSYNESALYGCDKGCVITRYFCNEAKDDFCSTDMKYRPFTYEELYIPNDEHECAVCKSDESMEWKDYAGCIVTDTCYHEELGRSKGSCDHCKAVYDCPGHDSTSIDADGNEITDTDYCSSELGCDGYYECLGHDHYGCPDGHEIKSCFGHVNLTMNVFMKEMVELYELGGVEIHE